MVLLCTAIEHFMSNNKKKAQKVVQNIEWILCSTAQAWHVSKAAPPGATGT